ncbi:MAG: type I-E CRISPR-associated protein Cse1/CasA [Magnetococcales bacterium]|nr:type I-E CRISPR-associated protein Cse1/CasA [Magnetococcales bacterium]
MHDFMNEPIIRVGTTGGGRKGLTLPGVLAGLVRDEIASFTALQPYQAHAWHAFLVQLAAIALHRGGVETPPAEESTWRDLLRALTADWPGDEPWQLVVEDLAKPALMQPPVPEGVLTGFKNRLTQPDEIDVLATSKNHDIKMARMGRALPDNWLMALVSLQTMDGYLGKGNYGIARMNSGYASRPGVGIRRDFRLAGHFHRDLILMTRHRQAVLESYSSFYRESGGHALLWLLPWDGQTSLALQDLDPSFIEVCRRVRLTSSPNGVQALGSASQSARIHADKELKGNLGDFWTPIRDGASLTVSRNGFDYPLVANLILGSGDYRQSPAQSQDHEPLRGDGEFLARVLTRGQGKTEGYHERRVPIPAKAMVVLGQAQPRETLAGVAKKRVEQCGVVANKALKPSLLTMIQEAPNKLNFKDGRAEAWLSRFDHQVDEAFFPFLWRSLTLEGEEAEAEWLRFLKAAGLEIMSRAEGSLIGGGARRYKTFAAAERVFHGALSHQFPLFRTHEGSSTDPETDR